MTQNVNPGGIGGGVPNQSRITILNLNCRVGYHSTAWITNGSIDLCRIELREQRRAGNQAD